MSDLGYGTETAEPAVASGPDDGGNSWRGEASPEAGYDGNPGAFAAEDQLPARQDARTATWDDDRGYDEARPSGEYDGELEALVNGDQLPSRQDSRAATWGDRPEYEDEADLGSEYDGDLDALTAADYALDDDQGDQGEAAADEVSPAAGTAGEAEAAERPNDGRARPETALEADLRELKAEYEASLAELKAELQALRRRQEAPDAAGGTGRKSDQPRAGDLPVDQKNQKEVRPEGDRPGPWSNAKTALYGAIGTTVGLAAADQFAPWAPHAVVDIAAGAVTIATLLVPTLREGWVRKHDDSPNRR